MGKTLCRCKKAPVMLYIKLVGCLCNACHAEHQQWVKPFILIFLFQFVCFKFVCFFFKVANNIVKRQFVNVYNEILQTVGLEDTLYFEWPKIKNLQQINEANLRRRRKIKW